MYVDVLGLVTTGVGCLIDDRNGRTPETALALPWVRRGMGERATRAEISASWQAVKGAADRLKKLHFRFARDFSTVELTLAGVDELMLDRLERSEAWLRKTFPGWDDFAADAQLGIISMAWAAGPAFTDKFPMFTAAARRGDWCKWRRGKDAQGNDVEVLTEDCCAFQCRLREHGPDGTFNAGVVPRNLADHYLFIAAEQADLPTTPAGYRDVVHWAPPEAKSAGPIANS
jgi:hypothetical protein